MPISAISGANQYRPPGLRWCCRRCCLTISDKARKVLAEPAALANPFFRLVPKPSSFPNGRPGHRGDGDRKSGGDHGRLLAGASGYSPPACCRDWRHLHTSASHAGEIYIPRVTAALLVGVLLLVAMFRKLKRSCFRLWNCSHHHHGRRWPARVYRYLAARALAAVACRCCCSRP